MYSQKFLLNLTLLASALVYTAWPMARAACDVCQSNGAACVNLTSFHLCFGGSQPDTRQLFTCTDGLVCSDLPNICFQSSTRPASCGDTSNCGMCNENQVFACMSRTTFAFCFGALQPSDVGGTCPEGKICDASTKNFCIDEVQPNSIICALDASDKVGDN